MTRKHALHAIKVDPLSKCCPVRAALDVLRGRWKPLILKELNGRPCRYVELRASIPECSSQALTVQLRQLVDDGVVSKNKGRAARAVAGSTSVGGGGEYVLTPLGLELGALMDEMERWGQKYLARPRAGA